jgi:hypothetical protein
VLGEIDHAESEPPITKSLPPGKRLLTFTEVILAVAELGRFEICGVVNTLCEPVPPVTVGCRVEFVAPA